MEKLRHGERGSAIIPSALHGAPETAEVLCIVDRCCQAPLQCCTRGFGGTEIALRRGQEHRHQHAIMRQLLHRYMAKQKAAHLLRRLALSLVAESKETSQLEGWLAHDCAAATFAGEPGDAGPAEAHGGLRVAGLRPGGEKTIWFLGLRCCSWVLLRMRCRMCRPEDLS